MTAALCQQEIPYYKGRLWNKNMVARILEDERYIGAKEYPQIIMPEQFQLVSDKRKQMYGDVPELLTEAMHLNWTQNTVIMEAELTMAERSWYIRQADVRGLSKTELLQMIENSAYSERVLDENTEEWYNKNVNETTEEMQDEETDRKSVV